MTQKQRVLAKLMGSRFVPSFKLADHCLQYNTRIRELRKLGFAIDSVSALWHGHITSGFLLTTDHSRIDFKNCKLRVQ